MQKITMALGALLLAGCAQMGNYPGSQPQQGTQEPQAQQPEAPQSDELAQAMAALAATLPDGDVAVVRVANYGSRRLDTQALTEQLVQGLSQAGREVADLSGSVDAFDLLSARQAGRQGGHHYLLYGQIKESGDSLRLRVMALDSGIIVWSKELAVPR
ncbi:hypothetical protein PVT67_15250 [Gallaecimonas kandeliae]|uniref:hypothetical protein n=1 Tax=Gallaecimonas kandeliae TaxID=3029055 RepID=UPI0026498974|nr:hypothetical protein [Gallaecimonas kandeliae]WKE65004.1 hypothetical protein PVT67_15250 [Gallaecimonas kandeliae]